MHALLPLFNCKQNFLIIRSLIVVDFVTQDKFTCFKSYNIFVINFIETTTGTEIFHLARNAVLSYIKVFKKLLFEIIRSLMSEVTIHHRL